MALREFFGEKLEVLVQSAVRSLFGRGEVVVGEAVPVLTGDPRLPWLIVAPTMRVPAPIRDPAAVYLAAREAMRQAIQLEQFFRNPQGGGRAFDHCLIVTMTGMGTGAGELAPAVAARQMMLGISDAIAPPAAPASWAEVVARHAS